MPHCYRLLLLLATLLPSGCAVYVPMQGAAPDITRRGQLEATGSYSLTNRFDASVAYSPLPHLLVRAAASRKGTRREPASPDSSQYSHVSQYELSLGTYWLLGERGLLGALAGYGHLRTDARFYGESGTLLIPAYQLPHVYDGTYHKLLGEVYGRFQISEPVSVGATYRLANLYLTSLTDRGQSLAPSTVLRSELMFFARFRPYTIPEGLLQFQVALGGSVMPGYEARLAYYLSDASRPFRIGQSYFMVGVSFYPSAWWQQPR